MQSSINSPLFAGACSTKKVKEISSVLINNCRKRDRMQADIEIVKIKKRLSKRKLLFARFCSNVF